MASFTHEADSNLGFCVRRNQATIIFNQAALGAISKGLENKASP